MKKIYKIVLILLFFIVFLSGCSEDDVVLLELNTIQIPTETKVSIELKTHINFKNLKIDWKSSNEEYLDSLGNVYPTNEDKKVILTASIDFDKKEYERKFEIIVLKNNDDYPDLDYIYSKIENEIPDTIKDNLKLIYSIEDYLISYSSSNKEFLNDEGIINRDLNENKIVSFYIKIQKDEYFKIYIKNIKIEKISSEEKINEVIDYIKEYINKNNLNEILQVPVYYEKYNIPILWSTLSGNIVNQDGTINKTFETVKTKLVANIYCDDMEETISFNYTSLKYTDEEKFENIDLLFESYYSKEYHNYLSLLHLQKLKINQTIISINNYNRPGTKKPIPTAENILKAGYNKVPNKQNILWIVIHETGNKNTGANALSHSKFVNNNPSSNASWHYTVDDKSIYQHLPNDEIGYHAGDGTKVKGNGNNNGIGIEMCVNRDGDFELTLRHTAKLVASLMYEYNLKISSVKQHNYFSGKNCPETLRVNNRWEEFLDMIKYEYHALNIIKNDKNIEYIYNNLQNVTTTPFLVFRADSVNNFNLKINVKLDDKTTKNYQYNINMKKKN